MVDYTMTINKATNYKVMFEGMTQDNNCTVWGCISLQTMAQCRYGMSTTRINELHM